MQNIVQPRLQPKVALWPAHWAKAAVMERAALSPWDSWVLPWRLHTHGGSPAMQKCSSVDYAAGHQVTQAVELVRDGGGTSLVVMTLKVSAKPAPMFRSVATICAMQVRTRSQSTCGRNSPAAHHFKAWCTWCCRQQHHAACAVPHPVSRLIGGCSWHHGSMPWLCARQSAREAARILHSCSLSNQCMVSRAALQQAGQTCAGRSAVTCVTSIVLKVPASKMISTNASVHPTFLK